MSRSSVLAHIVREDDGTSCAVWGPFVLKSAFQPIFAFHGGKLSVSAFEGLIRPFRNDVAVPPASFFAALPAMDRFHLETLTRTLHLFNAAACLPKETALFVNFDPSVFVDRTIADGALHDMRVTLNEVGIEVSRVVCEVTEQKSASLDALHDFVHALRVNGFKIAVDDYGAEDSDIERIKALRPEIVKFDAHWITHLMESGPGFGLLSAMVQIFKTRGIVTVFEGIEENWQLELAERSGASMVQGYVLARPELAPTSFAAFPTVALPMPGTSFVRPRAAEVDQPEPPPQSRPPAKTFGRKIV
ncbi:EAL domain-containing protein [Mesorhizobium sp. LHD-90]|uniref:EAL domain-containing protein n=1 Tax=Mesorhizobium sp. LHD-90 TaxID=3071414 RepID=UPI0027DF0F59|nr:EAL domain-containing protein [Mesorhizobium sp. LHD-90]MDQ6436466.1 EAL domain-containing protein [Mesorhizobium sp. LHD-90]